MKIPQYLYGSNEDLQRYFALLVQQLQIGLSDNGWQLPQLTTAQRNKIINGLVQPFFQPVLPPGTLWYNSSVNKLEFITASAVPNISNATFETVTSS